MFRRPGRDLADGTLLALSGLDVTTPILAVVFDDPESRTVGNFLVDDLGMEAPTF